MSTPKSAAGYGSEMTNPASSGELVPQPADIASVASKGSNQLSLETPRNGMEYVLCESCYKDSKGDGFDKES